MSPTPTILVVDDSPFILDAFSRFLTAEGARVLVAPDGADALRRVEREAVDLVILDVRMPGLCGLEVLHALRQRFSPEDLPVIMVTVVEHSEEVVAAFKLGANDYVVKPLDFAVLAARIETQLRSRERVRSASRSSDCGSRAAVPDEVGRVAMPEMELGTILGGRYRLEGRIGQGHVGVVYRATQLAQDRPVAIKMLRTGTDPEREVRARFEREGRSICRIVHPNAVKMLDFSFAQDGPPFLVMELLEGHSLEQELRRHDRLSVSRCVEIVAPVCEVLAEAHGLGLVHRDIKPQNIFLHQGPRGEEIKVLDFGLAKLIDDTVMAQRVTLDGVSPGTPLYMAPERFSEPSCDGSADVYSLGMMLYELLAGRTPFDHPGDNPLRMALIHLSERPRPLRELVPEVPSEIDALVAKALDKDPRRRPTARDLGHRLAAAPCLGSMLARASG